MNPVLLMQGSTSALRPICFHSSLPLRLSPFCDGDGFMRCVVLACGPTLLAPCRSKQQNRWTTERLSNHYRRFPRRKIAGSHYTISSTIIFCGPHTLFFYINTPSIYTSSLPPLHKLLQPSSTKRSNSHSASLYAIRTLLAAWLLFIDQWLVKVRDNA